jgi:hypothetical protein
VQNSDLCVHDRYLCFSNTNWNDFVRATIFFLRFFIQNAQILSTYSCFHFFSLQMIFHFYFLNFGYSFYNNTIFILQAREKRRLLHPEQTERQLFLIRSSYPSTQVPRSPPITLFVHPGHVPSFFHPIRRPGQ